VVSEVPLSLTMGDTESVTIWSLKHELASSPRLGLHGFHQAGLERKPSKTWSTSATWTKIHWLARILEQRIEPYFLPTAISKRSRRPPHQGTSISGRSAERSTGL